MDRRKNVNVLTQESVNDVGLAYCVAVIAPHISIAGGTPKSKGRLMADKKSLEQRTQAATANPSVPKIYFNGYINNLSTGDVLVVLENNGAPVGVLNMSYTTAKSLVVGLGQVIGMLERATGRSMLTTQEVEKALQGQQATAQSTPPKA